jgi:hypothetical protein
VQGALRKPGAHGSPTVAPLLKQPDIEINRSGDSLSKLLADGEIDAVISSRPVEAIGSNPDIARLFPNYREVEKDYYRRTRIFPIMHLIVIRRDVHEANPFVAQSLYDALCDSKDRALALMKERGALRYMLPWLPADMDEIDDVFGGDPWPYGVEANRPTLEALVQTWSNSTLFRGGFRSKSCSWSDADRSRCVARGNKASARCVAATCIRPAERRLHLTAHFHGEIVLVIDDIAPFEAFALGEVALELDPVGEPERQKALGE